MEVIFAGFGGQGVLTSGLITAYLALKNGLETIWSPAYGGQMRGGKAYSMVKFDVKPIAEPIVTELDALIVMNQPSMDFCADLKEGGILLINSDIVDPDSVDENRFRVIRVPANTLAQKTGSLKSANVVMVGAFVQATGVFEKESSEAILCQFFEDKGKGAYNQSNLTAFRAGYDAAGKAGTRGDA